jgi:hypothetical protein
MHTWNPIATDDLGLGRIGHIDDQENEVAEAVRHRRHVGPTAADVPDAVHAHALHRHEADLARL